MKKSMYLFIILTIFTLAGCSKNERITSFIPTQPPADVTQPAGEEDTEDTQVTVTVSPTPRDIVVGQTTTMYVMLDEYGGFLNVRPTPSTEGAPVGFLVHTEPVDVIEIAGGWASILYNDAICYVNASFLVKERPAYIDPPTPTPVPVKTPTPTPAPEGRTPTPDI